MGYQGNVRCKVVYGRDRRRLTAILSLLIGSVLFFVIAPVGAQNRTLGEIQGSVTDPSGASVAGAQVVITNTLTGVSTNVVTNDSGVYDANALVPGTYSITVAKNGFKTFLQNGVLLRAEAISVNAALEVGSATQQVTVTAMPTLLQTQSAESRVDLSEELLTQLPNVGMSELGYTALIPGVQPTGQGYGANGLVDNAWISVNGTPGATQNFTMDGATRLIGGIGQGLTHATVPPEAIAQINYLSGNVGAEYGNGFAQFNVTTKSGTNQWHGSAFEYVQNNIFQARNYFSQPGVAVTPFHWNMYGGTIGGPIKKNKAFFFFSYQYNPTNAQYPGYFSLPTQAERNGDFSGVPTTVYDPSSLTMVGGVPTRTPLPGNKMDPSKIDSVAKAAQSYIPLPNYPYANQASCSTASGILPSQCFFQNDYYVGSVTNNTRWFNGRVDYDFSTTNRLDMSVMRTGINNPSTLNPGAPLNADNNYDVADYVGQISDFWTIRPNLVNEARFTLNREDIHAYSADFGKGYSAKIGLQGSLSPFFPGLSWGGYTAGSFNSGGERDTHLAANAFVPNDIVTWVKGKHVLKLGGEFDRFQGNFFWNSPDSFNFSGIDTRNPADPTSKGLGYADFLFGGVSSWSTFVGPETGARSWDAQLFVQDDYKAKPNLTVNLGVRYEAVAGWSEVQGRIANFNPTLPNPATGTFGAMCYGPSTAGCPTVPSTKKALFAPRLGFAWQPRANSDWSIRGGYGIYYEANAQQSFGGGSFGLGWAISGQKASTDNTNPVFQFSQGLAPTYYQYPTAAFRQPTSQNGNGVSYTPANEKFPFVQEWRLDVQRAVGSFVLDVAYVGSHGNDLAYTRSINQVPEGLLYHAATSGVNMQQYRPNPTFLSINTKLNDGLSLYNSLQLGLRKEFASGMSLIMNYTWSRTMDNGTNTSGQGVAAIQNDYNLSANWARSDMDVPNLFTTGIVYPIPVGKGKAFLNQGGVLDAVVGGWQVSSLIQAHSGLPFTPLVGTANLSGALDGNWFPNRIGSGKAANQSIHQWFDPSAFTVPSAGTFGDSGRNILRGPAMRQVDLSLMKDFKLQFLGKGGLFELKADSTDLFNQPNFMAPNRAIGTSGAGQITRAMTSRNLQFGARLVF